MTKHITEVFLHSKDGCPYCEEARAFLTGNDIPFTEMKHNDDAERQTMYDGLALVGPQRTVPQVVVVDDGERYRIGGATELRRSGIWSLFGKAAPVTQAVTPVASATVAPGHGGGVYVAEAEPDCCT